MSADNQNPLTDALKDRLAAVALDPGENDPDLVANAAREQGAVLDELLDGVGGTMNRVDVLLAFGDLTIAQARALVEWADALAAMNPPETP